MEKLKSPDQLFFLLNQRCPSSSFNPTSPFFPTPFLTHPNSTDREKGRERHGSSEDARASGGRRLVLEQVEEQSSSRAGAEDNKDASS